MERENKIKNETLRYLGYRGQDIDPITQKIIDETLEEIKSLVDERTIYKEFHLNYHNDRLFLQGTDFELMGEDIKNHLKDSNTCILMGATLGHKLDTRIRYYEKVDMARALILDAASSAFIEEVCDNLCEEIEKKLLEGRSLTFRYSPGYGDLPIGIQYDFLKLLDGQKTIGLNVSSNSILIPRKSVTAIIGIVKKKDKKEQECKYCNKYNSCDFSKEVKEIEN